jgi:histone H3/H4
MVDAATRAVIQDLLLRTTGLRFDEAGVIERLIEAAQHKTVALLEDAQRRALANGRTVVQAVDVALLPGLSRALAELRTHLLKEDIHRVLHSLAELPFSGQVDEEVKELVPLLIGTLIVVLGRTVKGIGLPGALPTEERIRLLASPPSDRPSESDVRRAVEVVGLWL